MRNILENKYFIDLKSNIFVKNGNNFIFIKKMYRYQNKLEDITIFEYKNQNLLRIIKSKSAQFTNNIWRIKNATIYIPPTNMNVDVNNKLNIKIVSEMNILKGFKPTILDNIGAQKISLSITDALNTISLLKAENIATNKIRGILYTLTIFPIFAPFLIIILFYFSPISHRLSNTLKVSSIFVFISLIIWGLLYALVKFASINTINSELGAVLPEMILILISLYFYKKL
jgi:lipopolysaccharide export system permease protein